jgi:methionine synthase II (cobalamin-independent)
MGLCTQARVQLSAGRRQAGAKQSRASRQRRGAVEAPGDSRPPIPRLNNRVLDRSSAAERKDIGVHTCPGGDRDSTHSADVDYADLVPSMFKMNAGYFLIQLASEKDKERVYRLIGEHSREDADGVAQVCFIGVINPQNPRVETPQEVCDDLLLASKHIPKERLGSTDDCGFSPFSIDVKPKHGSPDVARDIAFEKIRSRVEGTRMASEKLGVH